MNIKRGGFRTREILRSIAGRSRPSPRLAFPLCLGAASSGGAKLPRSCLRRASSQSTGKKSSIGNSRTKRPTITFFLFNLYNSCGRQLK